MRNLKLVGHSVVHDSTFIGCQQLAIDSDVKCVYFVNKNEVIQLDSNTRQVRSLVVLPENESSDSSVICLQHLFDQMTVFIAISNGDLVQYNISTDEVECVGTIEGGIRCVAWSPDMEIFVIFTGTEQLVLMSSQCDQICEVFAHPSESAEVQMMAVGWGKKETQFQGSAGKQAAFKTSSDIGLAGISPFDDRKPRINWRGDGQYFVVSSINTVTDTREVRVWTRNGVLHSLCEVTPGIGQAVSYKPSGGLVSSTVIQDNKIMVVFYEKNGLRKNNVDFKVQPHCKQPLKVMEMLWNIDSTVLAIWYQTVTPADSYLEQNLSTVSCVELWTINNYHWYMKQSLEYNETNGGLINAVVWDPVDAYQLHIILNTGYYVNYRWVWTTNHSLGYNLNDQCTVAVVDADRVLMTPFRTMVVPPPMSAFYLQLPSAVLHVAFCQSASHSNDLLILLTDYSLLFYTYKSETKETIDTTVKLSAAGGNGFAARCLLPQLRTVLKFSDDVTFPRAITHLLWTSEQDIVYCVSDGSNTTLSHCGVDWTANQLVSRSSCSIPDFSSVEAVAYNAETHNLAVELCDGRLLQYNTDTDILQPWMMNISEMHLPQVCHHIALCNFSNQEVILARSEKFRFYVNGTEVANNCTSFVVHDEFLLITTHSHICQCISRRLDPSCISSKLSMSTVDESIRQVERGSRLVCAVPTDTKVVLQMPRGNLEVIHPRSLVLSAARRHIDELRYSDAFYLMKKHRINMNLLYDHDPASFLDNVDVFITQLDLPTNINLFLTDLVKEDVTTTMYSGGNYSAVVKSQPSVNKLDTVCGAVQLALLRHNIHNKYALSLITTDVKKSTPELDTALQRIQTLKESADSVCSVSEALNYLLYLVDVNELYNVALGTYDFSLVLMVAEKSQKDPKEYLPQLNELRKLDVNYQRFRIDVQLKRFERALGHIFRCGADRSSECLSFIKEHKLFAHALKLYDPSSTEYAEVCSQYGEHLLSSGQYKEAGLILLRANQLELATKAFESCNDWRNAIVTATQHGLSVQAMQQLARRLSRKLFDTRQYIDAACLLEQYCDDYEEAIVALINGNQWDEALRLIYKYKRTDFIETNVKPAVTEAFSQQMALFDSLMQQFTQYSTRLRIVRTQKLNQMLQEAGDGGNNMNADLYSDTTSLADDESVTSRSTRSSTNRSGRSRQKQDKKQWSLREGSRFEHLALSEALHNIVLQADRQKDDVSSLVRALLMFKKDSEATQLQCKCDELLKVIAEQYEEIWCQQQTQTKLNDRLGPTSTVNSILSNNYSSSQQTDAPGRQGTTEMSVKPPPALRQDKSWRYSLANAV